MVAIALVAVGALAVAAVGVFAVRALTGGGGGASSPEAAVEALADALEAEDPIAALDAMDPDEVRALGDVVESAADRAEELGFSPEDRTFGGVDLGLTGVRYQVAELGDGIARVTVEAGSARAEVDRRDLGGLTRSVVDAVTEEDGNALVGRFDAADLAIEDQDGDAIEPFVVTVERDGGWYVSPLHTAAQYLVDAMGLADPDVPAPEPGEGAEDPEAAVRDLLVAAGEVDGDAVGDLVAGSAGPALRAYRGALEEWVGAQAEDVSAEVDSLETELSDRDGGGRRVVVTELEGTVTWTDPDDGEEASNRVSWDGECLTVGDPDELASEPEGDSVEASSFCLTDGWARVGVEDLAVVVVEEGGTWRVDPLATVADYAAAMVPELDEALVLRALEVPEAAEPTATLGAGDPTTVELDQAGVAVLELDVATDDRFTITTEAEGDQPVDAYLVDGAGEYQSAYDVVEAGDDADYTLVVYTDTWAPGEVTVAVNPVVEETIEPGDTVDGELETGAEVVEYAADLEADTSYVVDLEDDGFTVEVVDPDGIEVDVDDAEEAETVAGSFTTGAAGTYRIRVDGGPERTSGTFSLTLEDPAPFVLGDGSTTAASGEITGPDDEQFIDLLVRGGEVVSVDVTTTDPAFDIVVILREPDDDSEIERFDDGGPGRGETIEFTPTEDRTWRISVQGKSDTTGTYRVEAYE